MKIWLLRNNTVGGYDTYDSAVAFAETEKEARSLIHDYDGPYPSWCTPEELEVEYLGITDRKVPASMICESFNAG
jgi:hypothetical protein